MNDYITPIPALLSLLVSGISMLYMVKSYFKKTGLSLRALDIAVRMLASVIFGGVVFCLSVVVLTSLGFSEAFDGFNGLAAIFYVAISLVIFIIVTLLGVHLHKKKT